MEKPKSPEAAPTEPGVQTARQLAAKILAASPGGTYGQIPVDYLTAAIAARDRQHEAALAESRAEVEALKASCLKLEQREKQAWDEVHVQAARNQRLAEDNVAGTSSIVRMVVKQRDELEAALAASRAETARAESHAKRAEDIAHGIQEELRQREEYYGQLLRSVEAQLDHFRGENAQDIQRREQGPDLTVEELIAAAPAQEVAPPVPPSPPGQSLADAEKARP